MHEARALLAAAFEVADEHVPADAALDSYDRWDSLGHVQVLLHLERALGRPLEVEEALAVLDLRSVQTLLESADG
jgi:acyl carrier protein